jgi:hypothetical protein
MGSRTRASGGGLSRTHQQNSPQILLLNNQRSEAGRHPLEREGFPDYYEASYRKQSRRARPICSAKSQAFHLTATRRNKRTWAPQSRISLWGKVQPARSTDGVGVEGGIHNLVTNPASSPFQIRHLIEGGSLSLSFSRSRQPSPLLAFTPRTSCNSRGADGGSHGQLWPCCLWCVLAFPPPFCRNMLGPPRHLLVLCFSSYHSHPLCRPPLLSAPISTPPACPPCCASRPSPVSER